MQRLNGMWKMKNDSLIAEMSARYGELKVGRVLQVVFQCK